jgi:hypothetical protein
MVSVYKRKLVWIRKRRYKFREGFIGNRWRFSRLIHIIQTVEKELELVKYQGIYAFPS